MSFILSPIFPENGFGTYYFYFRDIDQTIAVVVSSLDNVLLVSPGVFLYVGGNGDFLIV